VGERVEALHRESNPHTLRDLTMRRQLIRGGQHNIGHLCTRQQCEDGLADKVALRWISPAMQRRNYSFLELEQQSNRFANVLQELGITRGEVVVSFVPRLPEQMISFLGTLKLEAVAGCLFPSFGEEALLDRLGDARASVVLAVKRSLRKLLKIRPRIPSLRYILLLDADRHESDDVLSWSRLMATASDQFQAPVTSPDTPSVLHYTSGSTGKPKGVLHVHRSILHLQSTSQEVLGLRGDEVYWCTADQGWVTGTSYGIIGPWSLGTTQVHFGGGYDASAWMSVLEQNRVETWYTAPTALRMLMREDPALFAKFDLAGLRQVFSVGEPLNPEVIQWGRTSLQREIHDTWFQTETGGILISNRPGLSIRSGSMGIPVSGIEAAILDESGAPVPDGQQGCLCVRAGWPSQFVTYLNHSEVYGEKFRNGFYYSGDKAHRDAQGYYWFSGREDDVINTAGHLVSPFEVESALLEVQEVAESGVVAAPDPLLFEKVVAFVCLHPGVAMTKELELKIRLHVSNRISTIATPQEVIVVDRIPKNRSGKIMRRVLRAHYRGDALGDISTLEEES